MSFSLQAKDELLRIDASHVCCLHFETIAAIQAIGVLQISNKKASLVFFTEKSALCRKLFSNIKKLTDTSAEIVSTKGNALQKSANYKLTLSSKEAIEKLLSETNYQKKDTKSILQEGILMDTKKMNDCCKKAYLRMLFIAAGSVTNPQKSYHLEYVLKHEKLAHMVREMLIEEGFAFKLTERKNNDILYLKDADSIGDFLAYMGAYSAILTHENVRVIKQMRNDINRTVNCETANVQKTVNAAIEQTNIINFIIEKEKFDTLSAQLQQAAEGRLQNPEASIAELGALMDPPIGKSGMVNRLKKLSQYAEQLGYPAP